MTKKGAGGGQVRETGTGSELTANNTQGKKANCWAAWVKAVLSVCSGHGEGAETDKGKIEVEPPAWRGTCFARRPCLPAVTSRSPALLAPTSLNYRWLPRTWRLCPAHAVLSTAMSIPAPCPPGKGILSSWLQQNTSPLGSLP